EGDDMLREAGDRGHGADVEAARFEDAALLDVELDEGRDAPGRPRRGNRGTVVAVRGERLGEARSRAVAERMDGCDRHLAGHRRRADGAAPETRAFLAAEDDHL